MHNAKTNIDEGMKSLKSCLGVIVVLVLLTCVSGFIVYQVSDFVKGQSSKQKWLNAKEQSFKHIVAAWCPVIEGGANRFGANNNDFTREIYLLVKIGKVFAIHYSYDPDLDCSGTETIFPVTVESRFENSPIGLLATCEELTITLIDPTKQITPFRPNGDYWKTKNCTAMFESQEWDGALEIWDSTGIIGRIQNVNNFPED